MTGTVEDVGGWRASIRAEHSLGENPLTSTP